MGEKVFLGIYMNKDFLPYLEALNNIAKREGKSRNDIIREALKKFVEEHGYGNPNFKLTDFAKGLVVEAFPTLGHDPEKYPLSQVSEELLARIWVQAKKWLSAAEYELQRRKGGPITFKTITIP